MPLKKNHDIQMGVSTLKRRIKSYGLKIKRPDYNIDDVRASVQIIIDGHGCLLGYRSVWHALKLRGTRVPRIVVQELLREMDPESSENFVASGNSKYSHSRLTSTDSAIIHDEVVDRLHPPWHFTSAVASHFRRGFSLPP